MNRALESLDVMVAEIGELKQLAKKVPSARSHQYLVGFG